MPVRCITTGKGEKGAVIVCETPEGDVIVKAVKTAPGKYDVYSEMPSKKYKTVILAPNTRELRKRVEEWIEHETSKNRRNTSMPQPRPVGV